MGDFMNTLFSDKFFYHIYPLGLCGCPKQNDFASPRGYAFEKLTEELDKIKSLGVNALYIGPIFESTAHGYDTLDYFHVDRRLGNNESFAAFCVECHNRGIAVILDAVFNHTGRHFFAFRDLQQKGWDSQYKDWYLNVDYSRKSCFGDNFDYEGWTGCKDLVKLNLENQEVRNHLFSAVDFWIDTFKIDGLRLDAADVISKDFLDALNYHCKNKKNDFWLMGEVVHGDYNDWVKDGRLDSVTNYQIYKALWSSLNDNNLFELSYNLNREFGGNGMYKSFLPYNFLDNHDVNRIASNLKNHKHLFLIYAIFFLIPGIPSIYYGSELGIRGKRGSQSDFELRPSLPPFSQLPDFANPIVDSIALTSTIKTFSKIRQNQVALQLGNYKELSVTNETFAFERNYNGEKIIVAINASNQEKEVSIGKNHREYGENLLTGEKIQLWEKIYVPKNWVSVIKTAER